ERRPGARLALLAALAPSRIGPADVAAWRRPEHTDHCLVHLVAYGAFAAVDRVESTLSAPTTVEEPS
ncbi:DNA-binding protein, partial [Streptomyces geysiriensis]|nr:DNA-binding protein [Streptomyces geysiriensis]